MLDHYEHHLGPILETIAVLRGIRVLAFRSPFEDSLVLATDGMRDVAAPGEQPSVELVMLATPADASACAAMLCDLAHYPRDHGTLLDRFHAVPVGAGIVPGSRLTSLLLTMPWFWTAEFYACGKGRRVDMVQVIPISERERALFREEGCEALESALEAADFNLVDLGRESVV